MASINHSSNTPAAAPASSKNAIPPAKSVDTQSVLKRLQSELMALMMSGEAGISAFPEEDNIFTWKGTISGIKETVFEGTEYKLSLAFPSDYPFKPPKVKFETGCFHPNVDLYGTGADSGRVQVVPGPPRIPSSCLGPMDWVLDKFLLCPGDRAPQDFKSWIRPWYGNICLDILQDKWSSAYDVRTILLSIQSLLGEPNTSSPLNNEAAAMWSNQEEYRKMVMKLYKSI